MLFFLQLLDPSFQLLNLPEKNVYRARFQLTGVYIMLHGFQL